ncbi:MAG: PAS-domain containing protein [Holosporales bacterium]|jgi:signal transduction histidine kinase|nr:PAS-domain containing protein [Holosporales bacterium]
MDLESEKENIYCLLTDSVVTLPLAFAVWKLQGDEVVVSNKLASMISADDNFVDPYEFVKLTTKMFNSFLNIAVEKVSDIHSNKRDYSSTINLLGEDFFLKLSFNENKKFYIFIVENSKENDKNNTSIEFEKILDALPVYVWQKNKDLKITYCNKAYANALESTPEHVISNNIKLIPISQKGSIYVDQSLYFSKLKKMSEHVVINGDRRLLAIEETPFLGGEKSTGIAIDITDKETLEREYKNYKKQTEEVLDNISVPIAIFDEETNLVLANTAVIKLFSVEGLDLGGNSKFSDIIDYILSNESIISPLHIQKYKKGTHNLFQTISAPHHTSIYMKNGTTVNLSIFPNRGGGLMFMFEDISDKIALAREVNSISAIQVQILEHLDEGIIVFGPDNRIKITNPAIDDMLGKTGDYRLPGIHIVDFFQSIYELFVSKEETEVQITMLIDMASQRVKFSGTASLLSGKIISYNYLPLPEGLNLIKFLDITDNSSLEKITHEKTDLIAQMDKFKSSLISHISYKLRAPLRTITGFAEILYNRYFGDLNERQLEYCYGIARSSESISDIVDAVISLADIESGQIKMRYTEVNLLNFINDAISSFLEKMEKKHIDITTDFSDQVTNIFIDEYSMKKAVFYLISRAAKVSSVNGKISISVEYPKSTPGYFNLIIRDNGIGLTEEDLDKIRNIFLKDVENLLDNSLDFELLAVGRIIRLHNGKVLIDSIEEKGTTVSCCIPVKQFL